VELCNPKGVWRNLLFRFELEGSTVMSQGGKYNALIVYIILVVLVGCILVIGAITMRRSGMERPDLPVFHPHSQLPQS